MSILTIARQDLTLMMRDRASIFWVFIAPFLWVGLFGQMAGGGSASDVQIGLTVRLLEESAVAERFIGHLQAENFALDVVRPGAATGDQEDPPTRSITIPTGFEAAVLAREEVHLPFEESRGANSQATFAADLAVHRAVVRLLAGEALGGMDPADDLIKVSSSWAGVREVPRGYDQAVPGYLVMFTFMSTLIYGAAGLANERKNGVIARLGIAPISRTELVMGKLAGRALIALLQASIFLGMGATVFRVDWSGSPLGLLVVLVPLILCASGLALMAGTLFRSPEAASGIGVVISLVMSALGGCWWPAEIMPRSLQLFSLVFPTSWAMNAFHELISWGGGLVEVLPAAIVLTLFAAAATGLAVYRLDPAP
jgi:ABC-type polysaccharide/polyol phosphate export permease